MKLLEIKFVKHDTVTNTKLVVEVTTQHKILGFIPIKILYTGYRRKVFIQATGEITYTNKYIWVTGPNDRLVYPEIEQQLDAWMESIAIKKL